MDKIICLIPAYNEEKTIFSVVTETKKYLDNVIIVDDGSLDNTQREIEKAGVVVKKHHKNIGKGAALRTGFEYILKNFPDFEAVISLDADGQHDPAEIPKFIDAFRKTGADLILGERLINKKEMPFLKRISNNFVSWLISKKIGQKISDTQSGFRLFSKRFLEKMGLKSIGYGAETEILMQAVQNKFRVSTIPISTIYFNKKHLNLFKNLRIIISILRGLI